MSKVYIKTQGCSHNFSDSEHMAGVLKKKGHNIVASESEADIILFNTCTVKTPSENAFLRNLKKAQKENKKIVIGGCVPQADPQKYKDFSLIGTRQLDQVAEVIEKTESGEIIQLPSRNTKPHLSKEKIRRNPLIEIIPVSLGCMSACSFCKTKAARGTLSSYTIEEIVDVARLATSHSVKELWLTSQDTGCYGFDINTDLADLLQELCKIEKEFMIRVGMANPQHIIKIQDKLIEAFKHPKVFKFLHVPVQAGNDQVLRDMKRDYTVEQFKSVITAFRKQISTITIATDIICGFPSETKEQFDDTVKLIQEVQPDVINISRFWPRPGTIAAKQKQLQSKEIMRRSGIITKEYESAALARNRTWIGWKGEITVTEHGKNNTEVGRNYAYKPVIVRNQNIGAKTQVIITHATSADLRTETTD